jgi:hypothetical protein
MNEIECARSDLQTINDLVSTLEGRITGALVNLREHLNRLEVQLENRPEPQPVRKYAPRGTSVTADPASVFFARVEAGDTIAKSILDMLARVGLTAGADGKSKGYVRCFSTLEAIYLRNADLAERSLRVIVDAWNGTLQSLRADVVGGVAAFLADAGAIDTAELARRLRPLKISDVLEATKGDRRRNLPIFLADVYTR